MLARPLAKRRCTLSWNALYLDMPMSFEYRASAVMWGHSAQLVPLGGGEPAAGGGVDGGRLGCEGAARVLHPAVVAAHVGDPHHQVAGDLPLELHVPLVRVGVLPVRVVEVAGAVPGLCPGRADRQVRVALDRADRAAGGVDRAGVEARDLRPAPGLELVLAVLATRDHRVPHQRVAGPQHGLRVDLPGEPQARPEVVLDRRQDRVPLAGGHDVLVVGDLLERGRQARRLVVDGRAHGRHLLAARAATGRC